MTKIELIWTKHLHTRFTNKKNKWLLQLPKYVLLHSEKMEGKRALEVKTTYKEEFGEKEKKFKDRFWEDYSRRRCSFLQFYMKDLRVIAKKGKIHVDILKSIHSRTHGGHLGIDKTLVTRWIFWLKQARSNIMKWGGGADWSIKSLTSKIKGKSTKTCSENL